VKESEAGEERYEAPRGVEAGGSPGVLPKRVEACGSPEVLPRREAAEDQNEDKRDFLRSAAKKKKVAEMRRGQAGSAQKRGLEGCMFQTMASKKIQKTWRRLQRKKERKEKKRLRSYDASERGGVEQLPSGAKILPEVAATTLGTTECTDGKSLPFSSDQGSHALGLGQDGLRKKQGCEGVEGMTLGSISTWLDSRMDAFFARHCKTMSTGRLFPLPSSSCTLATMFPQVSPCERCVLRCLTVSLNSLNGEGLDGPSEASEYQRKVMEGLLEDCSRVAGWIQLDPQLSWADFFRAKGVDY